MVCSYGISVLFLVVTITSLRGVVEVNSQDTGVHCGMRMCEYGSDCNNNTECTCNPGFIILTTFNDTSYCSKKCPPECPDGMVCIEGKRCGCRPGFVFKRPGECTETAARTTKTPLTVLAQNISTSEKSTPLTQTTGTTEGIAVDAIGLESSKTPITVINDTTPTIPMTSSNNDIISGNKESLQSTQNAAAGGIVIRRISLTTLIITTTTRILSSGKHGQHYTTERGPAVNVTELGIESTVAVVTSTPSNGDKDLKYVYIGLGVGFPLLVVIIVGVVIVIRRRRMANDRSFEAKTNKGLVPCDRDSTSGNGSQNNLAYNGDSRHNFDPSVVINRDEPDNTYDVIASQHVVTMLSANQRRDTTNDTQAVGSTDKPEQYYHVLEDDHFVPMISLKKEKMSTNNSKNMEDARSRPRDTSHESPLSIQAGKDPNGSGYGHQYDNQVGYLSPRVIEQGNTKTLDGYDHLTNSEQSQRNNREFQPMYYEIYDTPNNFESPNR